MHLLDGWARCDAGWARDYAGRMTGIGTARIRRYSMEDTVSVQLFSDSHLYRTGSLKWTGITTASGEPTIGAWIAEMDFGTAPEVADAMKGAIDDGLLGYQPTWLEPRIAGATAEFQKRRFGWDVDASQVRIIA